MATADIEVLKSEVREQRLIQNKLLRIVVDGNGLSLVSRQAVLEAKMTEMERVLNLRSEHSYMIWLQIVAGILGAAGAIGVFFLELVLNKHT